MAHFNGISCRVFDRRLNINYCECVYYGGTGWVKDRKCKNVCVCVCERREREKKRNSERVRERIKLSGHVHQSCDIDNDQLGFFLFVGPTS